MTRAWHWGVVLAGASLNALAVGAQVTTLYSFKVGSGDGFHPFAPVVRGSDGALYGTNDGGGALSGGTVYRVTIQGQHAVVHSFGVTPGDGADPYGGLVQGADGYFYGTTEGGGGGAKNSVGGTVFKVSSAGVYLKLHTFGEQSSDGVDPESELVFGSDGYLYGVTPGGGPYNGAGTLFKISTDGAFTNLYNFSGQMGQPRNPVSGLVLHPDGNLYGTTQGGGLYGAGTVYKVSPAGEYSSIYEFGVCDEDGLYPRTTPVVGPDGALYGVASAGGMIGYGTVYRVTTAGKESTLYSFGSLENDGADPRGSPLFLADGTLLGTTSQGGVYREYDIYGVEGGTVYALSPTGVYSQLHSFGGAAEDPEWLWGGLTAGGDGSYYGTSFWGGTDNGGAVYKVTLTGGTSRSIQTAPTVCAPPKPHITRPTGGALNLFPLLLALFAGALRRRPACAPSSTTVASAR